MVSIAHTVINADKGGDIEQTLPAEGLVGLTVKHIINAVAG